MFVYSYIDFGALWCEALGVGNNWSGAEMHCVVDRLNALEINPLWV